MRVYKSGLFCHIATRLKDGTLYKMLWYLYKFPTDKKDNKKAKKKDTITEEILK